MGTCLDICEEGIVSFLVSVLPYKLTNPHQLNSTHILLHTYHLSAQLPVSETAVKSTILWLPLSF